MDGMLQNRDHPNALISLINFIEPLNFLVDELTKNRKFWVMCHSGPVLAVRTM